MTSSSHGTIPGSFGDHGPPYLKFLRCPQHFCHICTMKSPYKINYSAIFALPSPLLRFFSTICVVTRCSIFSLLVTWPKKTKRGSSFLVFLIEYRIGCSIFLNFLPVHVLRSISDNIHTNVASSSLLEICFEIAQVSHPYTRL